MQNQSLSLTLPSVDIPVLLGEDDGRGESLEKVTHENAKQKIEE